MKYCSVTCQQRDAAQHSMLCSTFQDFQERPSPNHFRSIYFPVDELNPRFIWLRMMGTRGSHVVDDEDLSQYVSGNQSGGICTSSHYGITPEREYKTMIVVQHDGNMFGNFQVVNWCLLYLLGPEAHRWRGGYVGHGYKYSTVTDPDDYDDTDAKDSDDPLIAVDLDTTSLGPLIAYF
ncbi:hypothetical protein COCC4DRAFT_154761 [Bipolaris maydis ATCC 48331]|uniref:Suppressor of anucleate metulae protein B n=1 Tax=Cochliobolus heterostrophus (strain C4 / ATCC 48331 / race T) TaxID=665024 RepID=N4WWT4_COCH4|nr:uncharacterized protein COCC4DRAFT_154761 [Bipolaris maydis ATCC 48331]ENH98845.1 hypothetical protein COCC4DRAFT_154761 [Bipolaris maydis ATCC 48331]KAJ6199876.1 hypothetical protein J3E72DRAFT_238392 [Bipolaris maydis]